MPEPILQREELQKLIGIVARLYDFTDGGVRGRRVFIQESAGLGRFIPGMDLAGAPRTVASDLIGRLERFGQLPERPTYHSLGALLEAVLGLDELGNEEATFVAGLIVRYALIADPAYLEKLRGRYGITEEMRREPPAENVSPRIGAGQAPESPGFAAQLGDEETLEAIINSEDNFLDIHLLSGASYCAQAVGKIEIPEGESKGTGFLVGPDLLLTNQHVLKERDYLEEAIARFGYMNDASGVAPVGKVVRMLPDFYFSSPADKLDYALVRLQERPLEEVTATAELAAKPMVELAHMGKHRGYLVLAPRTLVEHSRVNIIQHPDGNPLKVVMTQNYIVHQTDSRVQYVADTMSGSSGSPVFNQKWEVVALHHSGSPYPPESLVEAAKKAWKGRFRVNEGILMRAILKDFQTKGIDRHLPRL